MLSKNTKTYRPMRAGSCKQHDYCYSICGKSKKECDQEFHNNLRLACARIFNTIICKPAKESCFGVVKGYFEGVQTDTAQKSYNSIQSVCRPEETNTQFIERMYSHLLQRGSDPSGMSTYTHYLKNNLPFPPKKSKKRKNL
jgi:hypothetical protein